VDETAHGVGSDQSKKPQDDQNNSNRIDHGYYPFVLLTQAFDRVSSSESCRRRLLCTPPRMPRRLKTLRSPAHTIRKATINPGDLWGSGAAPSSKA
jgi:hypothetical protein